MGKYLYMVDTSGGVRVFDTEYMLEAATGATSVVGRAGSRYHAGGYKYVLPQVGTYAVSNPCNMRFSWLSLDRSVSPPTLLSGEYPDSGAANGRMFRWRLGPDGRLLTGPGGVVVPSEAFFLGHARVQGGLSWTAQGEMRFWLTGKRDGRARLFRKSPTGPAHTFSWTTDNTPQNLHYSPFSDNLWNLAEFRERPVFACKLADLE